MEKKSVDLLNGSILKSLVLFSIPLLIGNLFQQMYNTVDSYVVGNYIGKAALAAVGASSPIINMLIGFFMGLAAGAGVVLAQRYGAKDDMGVHKTVHTTMALTLCMGVVLTIVGLCLSKPILHAVNVPMDIFEESSQYLNYYFLGIIFTLVYNVGAGILNATGDSKRPLYFLITASIINVVLDVVFVRYLQMGIVGVAVATMIAQATSACLVLRVLLTTNKNFKLVVSKIRFDLYYLKQIVKIGLPTALQQSIVSLSNIVVQSYVNVFGSSVVAGFAAGLRIDGFMMLPLQTFNLTITTFVGQNIGAKQYDRVKKGIKTALLLCIGVIVILSIGMFVVGEQFIALFNNAPDVVAAGRLLQLTFIGAYVALPFCQIYNGALRGAGKSAIPMYVMVFNFVILRQIYLLFITEIFDDLVFVYMGWPVTWITCAIMFHIYYKKANWLPITE